MNALRQLATLGSWRHRRLLPALAAGVAGAALWMAAQVAIPLLTGSIVDQALLARDRHALALRVLALIGAATLSTLGKGAHVTLFAWLAERARAGLELGVLSRLYELPVSFFDEERSGRIQHLLAEDTAGVARLGSQLLSETLQATFQLGLVLAVLAVRYGRATFAALALIPIYLLLPLFVGRRAREAAQAALAGAAEAAAIRHESIQALREIKLFGREGWAVARVATRLGDETRRLVRLALLRSAYALNYAIYFLAAGLVYWFGGLQVLAGHLSLGSLVALVALLANLDGPVGTLARLGADRQRLLAAAERLLRVLAVETGPQAIAGDAVLAPGGHRLRFEDVEFRYPGAPSPVLRGVSFQVEPGQRVALVGPSGAGKSTLAALLLRLHDPQDGRILIDGREHRSYSLASLRGEIGLVLQDTLLFAGTVAENIRFGRLDATDREIEESARLANAHEFIARLPEGYATEIGERGAKLSGGQRQRLGIARMLLRRPGILVLDEAMSALDAPGERLVREALERLMQGRTTLSISHRPSVFADADRIFVLAAGRIVAAGRHADLLQQCDLYRGLAGEEQRSVARGATSP
jgi:ABC-type multidrug transport system fused ATPase/permease subunit